MCQTVSEEAVEFRFFSYAGNNGGRPKFPVRILFLTSVRDTGACDQNGVVVGTPQGPAYMEGVVERTVRATLSGGALAGLVEVAGVITDDSPLDLRGSDYSVLPQAGKPWIHSLDLRGPDCRLISGITFNLSSYFRHLPLGAKEERRKAKKAFEFALLSKMRQLKADILVSDHYMARLDFLFPPVLPFGRVLNIHPAITLENHPCCFRGKTPTADAIARAKTEAGVKTGATLHVVNSVIDDGPIIALAAGTPVHASDEPQHLRHRNYQLAKLPLFIGGMAHYVGSIYPHLRTMDFKTRLA